ncbi:copper resistance protein NlpE [Sphingobacterium bovisgrunnientis]|jgi:copper homeostasis protein (lipoprotein)|uniref:copper resistance protein NlpE n=1 Tax=Sphingobacterium bovisgrunnientis TaxID=1874697 RepID=UPI00135743A8|nr:copper resistance protein NlpE [Sphingobacterium bovisgrunnientis]
MRWLLSISFLLILIAVALSCVNNQKSVAAKDKTESMEVLSANLAGYYSGDLPCVDCEAINTMLELHKDNSYVLRYMYEGKSEDQFIKEGEWSIKKNMLTLEGVDYQYKINPDYLIQLDLAGNEIKGDLAEKYQLLRIR